MRRLVLCLFLLALGATSAFACGDKFLVWGRTARPDQVTKPMISARVLILQQVASPVYTNIHGTLKGFGHEVQTVATSQELTEALKSGNFDIVVADYAEASSAVAAVEAAASESVVLPLVDGKNEADLKAAKAQYHVVLKTPPKTNELLDMVARTLEKKGSLAANK